jgi:hypothetical protein
MLFDVDLYKDIIDEERVTVASVFSLQPAAVNGSELGPPQPDALVAHCKSTFGSKVFNISMTEI